MAKSMTKLIIDPRALLAVERERFADELYVVHDRIFDGVSRESFAAQVVNSPAVHTRIIVLFAGSEIVGYAASHLFEPAVGGKSMIIMRGEVGLLPESRRRSYFGWFLVYETFMAVVRNPGKTVW